jgi:hypothetical protein
MPGKTQESGPGCIKVPSNQWPNAQHLIKKEKIAPGGDIGGRGV